MVLILIKLLWVVASRVLVTHIPVTLSALVIATVEVVSEGPSLGTISPACFG